jgi:Cu-processing system ATP-binding protein
MALIRLKELIQREKAQGKTILITSHIMQFVEEMADKILYLLEGEIYFKGNIKELLEQTGAPDFEHAIAALTTTGSHA